jgi:hypothetical protein
MRNPMAHTYEFPRPALTVDCVVFGFDGAGLQVLLIKRGIDMSVHAVEGALEKMKKKGQLPAWTRFVKTT